MLFSAPAAHVSADFGDQLQRTIGANAVELAEVGAAGNAMERRAQLHPRFVLLGLQRGRAAGSSAEVGGRVPARLVSWASMAWSHCAICCCWNSNASKFCRSTNKYSGR